MSTYGRLGRLFCWLGLHRMGMLRHISDGHFARTCVRIGCEHTEWQDAVVTLRRDQWPTR